MNIKKWKIYSAREGEHASLLQLWEQSVRATHLFLTETDIEDIRPSAREALRMIETLLCVKDDGGALCGFMGVENRVVEMLFLSPKYFGRGIGRYCLDYARKHYDARFVDVNEQNAAAAAFYRRCGFKEISRSSLDAQGRPFPILHLERK